MMIISCVWYNFFVQHCLGFSLEQTTAFFLSNSSITSCIHIFAYKGVNVCSKKYLQKQKKIWRGANLFVMPRPQFMNCGRALELFSLICQSAFSIK